MRFRNLASLVLGLAAFGCGSSDESSDSFGDYYGGQTGSLIPSCGEVPSIDQGYAVPAGDSAFVVYAGGCGTALQESDVTLLDPGGAPVAFTFETAGDGALLVRASEALAPGEYRAATPAGVSSLVVVEPEPLPATLGVATVVEERGCGVSINLDIDEAMRPYLPLTRIDVGLDGSEPVEWFEYGSLTEEADGTALLRLDGCNPVCLTEGPHDITLQATIAGEEIQPAPSEISADVICRDDARSYDEPSGGCALAPALPRRDPRGHALVALSLLAFGTRRRRAR